MVQANKEAKALEEKPEEEKESGPKKKKINRLSLKELEKKIQQTQEKMGGLTSIYARQLLKRREQLLGGKDAADT